MNKNRTMKVADGHVRGPYNKHVPNSYIIERPVLTKESAAADRDTMTMFENRVLSAQVAELRETITDLAVRPVPEGSLNLDFTQHTADEQIKFWRFFPEPVPIHAGYGTRIFSPQYDNDWYIGGGAPWALYDGRPHSMALEGESASGFCIYLSSPQRVFVTATFQGTYKFSWASMQNLPNLSVSGGLGVCVRKTGDAEPALVRRSTLLDIRGPRAWTGDSGNGQLSNVRADSYPFAAWLQPVSFLMEPALRYAIWLWCWHAAVGTEGAPFLSFIGCDVPAITVTTSEPYFPPL